MELAEDPQVEAALAQVEAALDALADAGVAPADGRDATRVLRRVEAIGRRVRAQQVAVADEVDRRGLFRADAHSSARVHVRWACRLSGPEAARRLRLARALRHLPEVAAAFAAGTVPVDHADLVAQVHANPRVRTQLAAQDAAVADLARRLDYRSFEERLRAWVRLVDEDGARDRNQRSHENRRVDLVQDFDGTWSITGGGAAFDGARMRDVLDHFTQAEYEADWAEARARVGDDATAADLARTDGQRRWDALTRICDRAAEAEADRPGGHRIETVVVMDDATFERHLARLAGQVPPPVPRHQVDLDADHHPGRGYRCDTLSGHHLEPTEALANGLLGHIRRAVVGADSVVIDEGRRKRLFTGPAHLAARLQQRTCYWNGCWVPASRCQADHLTAWHAGGPTDQANAGPACPRHNRSKEHGYTVHRDRDGTWHTYRPDGTEIT